jgi:hypothetical protein
VIVPIDIYDKINSNKYVKCEIEYFEKNNIIDIYNAYYFVCNMSYGNIYEIVFIDENKINEVCYEIEINENKIKFLSTFN